VFNLIKLCIPSKHNKLSFNDNNLLCLDEIHTFIRV
jgi:hypothetical protein